MKISKDKPNWVDPIGLSIMGHQKYFSLMGGLHNRAVFLGVPKGKQHQPEFDSYINGNDWLIFLDWDRKEVHPSQLVELGICPFTSMSGRVKGMMIMKCDRIPTDAVIKDTVMNVLGEELFSGIDEQAFGHSYVMPTQFRYISSFKFKTYSAITDCRDWRFHHKLTTTGDRVMDGILSMVASFEGGHEEGMQLAASYVADTIGCSRSSAQRGIDKLQRRGLLHVVRSFYAPRLYGKTYRLCQDLIDSLASLLKKMGVTPCNIVPKHKTNYIPDGLWWRFLLPMMRHFATFEEAFAWFKALPGAFDSGKYRMSKLKSAWKHHAKNNGLPEVCFVA